MLEQYKHLKYNNQEIRMLVADNSILWHGPDRLDGNISNVDNSYCNVKYSLQGINYNFFIKNGQDEIIAEVDQTLSQLSNKVNINTNTESYSVQNTNTLNYTPSKPLALADDVESLTPRIFSESINLPTYSGHSFLEIPPKVYGETIVGQTGLSIEGILTQKEAKNDICMASFSSNFSLYATCSADKPAIIKYEPKYKYAVNAVAASDPNNPIKISSYTYTENGQLVEGDLYKADLNQVGNSDYFENVKLYDENGNELSNKNDIQWNIGIGCGFLIAGNNETITASKITDYSVYHLSSKQYNISTSGHADMAGGLFKWNGYNDFTFFTTPSTKEGREGQYLPEGDVIALIQIGSNPDPFFKKGYKVGANNNPTIGNNFWHFHVGGYSFALSTYKPAFPMKYTVTGWNDNDTIEVSNTGWEAQKIVHHESEDSLLFVPEENKWYALYLNRTASRNKQGINLDLIKIREATEEELNKWLTDEDLAIRTNGDVIVENESIKCDFSITLEDQQNKPSCTLTLPEAASLNTNIKVFEEYYHTTKNENESFKYYPYNKKYILKIDSNNSSPEIFDSGNPIDKVYYSGCTFKVYNDIIKMPNYYSGINSLNIIGLTYTDSNVQSKSLGQGVVAEGDGNNFVKYPSDNTVLPIINWNPQSFYRWQTTEPSSGEYIVKSGPNNRKIYYIKDPNLSIKNGQLNSTYCQSQCFEFAGPNAEPTGYSGYHWLSTSQISAIREDTRKLNTNILHGPDNGRFIGYFKFDSNLKQDLFTEYDSEQQKYVFKPTAGYFIHWHAYLNADNDFSDNSGGKYGEANVGAILLPKLRDDAYALCKHADNETLYNANTGILSKIYKYTKTGDTYNYSLTTPQVHKDADEVKPDTTGGVDFYFPELGKWYGLIINPNYSYEEYSKNTYRGRDKVIYLCEITNENGEVKEEHKPYLFSNQVERYCKKGVNSFLFSITINDTDTKTCSMPINDIETYFEVKKEDNIITEIISFKEEQKNNLINTYPEALFKPTNDLCLNIEKTANNKTIYNINNPICIPEMSGCRFVNVN